MPRLTELLASMLLRRLPREGVDHSTAALMARLEAQQSQVERYKETEARRQVDHAKLKRRYKALKMEMRQTKEQARRDSDKASRQEAEMQGLMAHLAALEEALDLRLSGAAAQPLQTGEDLKKWKSFARWHRNVWRYPMRLGVLRQHEPRPLKRECFPSVSPPGPQESWPLVSIVTPSFQQANFLERTMDSVTEQDYPRLDYRVMDGGSQDGSKEVIQRHADKLAGWRSASDSGPANAINLGFAESTGEIMAWLNSDDLLMPGAVRFVAAYFARHPEVDVVYGHRVVVDERECEVGRWVLPPHDGHVQLWTDFIPQETLFWRRSAWGKVGAGLDETFQFAFDWELILRFQKAGLRMKRLPYFLGCFRAHDAQKSAVQLSTVGAEECARLRQRELGHAYNERHMNRVVVHFQKKAIRYERLMRWGLRW